jgi:putative heme-binding domain-containing protein
MWIANNHPDWGSALRDYFDGRLRSDTSAPGQAEQLQAQLATFAGSEPIQELIGTHLANRTTPASTTQLLLGTIAAAQVKEIPSSWLASVVGCLAHSDENVVRAAVAAARTLNSAKSSGHELDASLTKLASDTARPEDLRLQALSAMSETSGPLDPASLSLLLTNVDPAKPVSTRGTAASVLVRAHLSDDQLAAVSKRLRTVSPLEATRLLETFEQSTNAEVGTRLVEDLNASKSRASLRVDTLQRVLSHYPQPVQDRGKELIESLRADLPKERAHLEELLQSIGKGDIRRGQLIFNGQKAACSSCHAMGYLGGHVGPDLTTIGQIRTERDLLESIVYPSASFVRSFEPYVVRTKSDDEYSGVLKKDAANEIVLATGPTTEVRIDRADIVDMRPGTVSVMPAGLEQQLSRQELADLVAFLKATKWGAQ